MNTAYSPEIVVTVIKPSRGWQLINLKELREYKDLFYFLASRDIKVLYAQTILGFAWAILNPLVQILLFGVVFGRLARVPTDGIPYILFSSVAIIPWTYMSEAMTQSSQSLITGQAMLGKIYFPRIIFPLTPVFSKLLDFGFSLLILLCVMIYYRIGPTWNLLLAPFFVVFMMCVPATVGMWLSALAIRFRDVKFAMPFVIRILMYTAPIIYSASSVPEKYRLLYSLNPLVGVIEGYRACLLGLPIPWGDILPGTVSVIVLFLGGMAYFRRMERVFADVI